MTLIESGGRESREKVGLSLYMYNLVFKYAACKITTIYIYIYIHIHILEASIHTMIQWRRVAKQDLTVYTSVGPLLRVLIVFKSCDLGAHCLEQSESEDAVQSLVERRRKERRGKEGKGRDGERGKEAERRGGRDL